MTTKYKNPLTLPADDAVPEKSAAILEGVKEKYGFVPNLMKARSMMPKRIEDLGVTVEYDLRKSVRDADVINVLRIQFERHGTSTFPNAREYMRLFGITNETLKYTKPECFVMHPGPMNRGVEISADVADGPRQVILQQVTNGVAVRMAVCYQFAGGAGAEATDAAAKYKAPRPETTGAARVALPNAPRSNQNSVRVPTMPAARA